MAIFGYIRVSTNKQNMESQRYEILKYCYKNNLEVTDWIEESISGVVKPNSRKLGELVLNRINKGDLILVTELSRLSRSIFGCMSIISHCLLSGAKIILVWKDVVIEDENPTVAISVFIDILNSAMERDAIRKRTKAALQMMRENGIILGRPIGTKGCRKLTPYKDDIINMLNEGYSKVSIARQYSVNPSTLYEFIRVELEGRPDYKEKYKL